MFGDIQGDPQATIDKMQTVRAAALAPAEPSGADSAIAADATQKLAAAQAELSISLMTKTAAKRQKVESRASFSSDESSDDTKQLKAKSKRVMPK